MLETRSANRQKCEAEGREIRFIRVMDAEERYLQKRLGFIKLSLNEVHEITGSHGALQFSSGEKE